jgi:hypothetical protein
MSNHRTHTLPFTTDLIGRDTTGHFSALADIALPNGRRHYLGGWDATGKGRIEHGGPYVPGPHAYAGPQPRVLAANRQPDRPLVTVNDGDVIEIADCRFTVRRDTRARFLRGDREISLIPLH